MLVKQISVFLENSKGRLYHVSEILANNNINIRALSIADTTDFGILRLIVNDPKKACDILKDNHFTVSMTDVIAIAVEDAPGGLSKALKVLSESDIGVEYMYAFVGNHKGHAAVILRVEAFEDAIKILGAHGIQVLSSQVVCEV